MLINLIKRLQDTPWLAEVTAFLLGVAYTTQSLIFAHTTYSVLDEGAYVYKGFLFMSGRYVPYQDYGPWTNHMPLSFLIPGVIQTTFTPGLRSARYFMVLLGLIMLIGVWILAKRFGGRWWALFAVAAIALNPVWIQYYSVAVSQGLVACLMVWAFVFTLGEERNLTQLILGSILAALTLLTRENMLPLFPLLMIYIFWQHGFRKGMLSTLAGSLLIVGFHALYWPSIWEIWDGWVPRSINALIAPQSIEGSRGQVVWSSATNMESRITSFLDGIQVNLIPIFGVFSLSCLSLFKKHWRSSSYWRAALLLNSLFMILLIAHAWSSLWKNYCVFCFSGYISFFSPIGLILIVLTYQGLKKDGLKWYGWLVVPLIVLISAAVGAGAALELGSAMLKIPVPRIKQGQLQSGFVPIQAILENAFSLDIAIARLILAILAGTAFGILLTLMASFIYRRLSIKEITRINFGIFTILIFLISAALLAPTPILAANLNANRCQGDVIAAYEQAGAQLAGAIPAGSMVDWHGGLSVIPMLYIPETNLYPPQINDGYSYRRGGDTDALLRTGKWNEELRDRWLQEADYALFEQVIYFSGWKEKLEADGFVEVMHTSPLDPCKESTHLFLVKKK